MTSSFDPGLPLNATLAFNIACLFQYEGDEMNARRRLTFERINLMRGVTFSKPVIQGKCRGSSVVKNHVGDHSDSDNYCPGRTHG